MWNGFYRILENLVFKNSSQCCLEFMSWMIHCNYEVWRKKRSNASSDLYFCCLYSRSQEYANPFLRRPGGKRQRAEKKLDVVVGHQLFYPEAELLCDIIYLSKCYAIQSMLILMLCILVEHFCISGGFEWHSIIEERCQIDFNFTKF